MQTRGIHWFETFDSNAIWRESPYLYSYLDSLSHNSQYWCHLRSLCVVASTSSSYFRPIIHPSILLSPPERHYHLSIQDRLVLPPYLPLLMVLQHRQFIPTVMDSLRLSLLTCPILPHHPYLRSFLHPIPTLSENSVIRFLRHGIQDLQWRDHYIV